ncbi:MAG: putative dsRNA-binding protein [Methanoregula sp.]|nr:putative dsRNA-binding protein [Methanoregula sp.]
MSRRSAERLTDLLRAQNPDLNRIIDVFVGAYNSAYGRPGTEWWDVTKEDWQRFEFLGDRVLNLVIAQYLYSRKGKILDEGEMTKILAGVVSNKSLGSYILKNNIPVERLIPPTIGAQKTYRERVTGGAFEAFIGALYCEGGLDDVAFFIISLFEKHISSLDQKENAIGELQEYFQQHGRPPPEYIRVKKEGTEHQPVYTYRVGFDKDCLCEGTGRTIAEAKQNAARAALRAVQSRHS